MKKTSYVIAFFLVFFSLGFAGGWMLKGNRSPAPVREEIPQAAATEARTRVEAPTTPALPTHASFDASRAMGVVGLLTTQIGIREEGTAGEHAAADSLQNTLRGYGIKNIQRQPFYLPNGQLSNNIIARVEGKNPAYTLVIGGHYDSRYNTTGANDNASGAACTVELARVINANGGIYPTVLFVLFGAEEDPGTETSHANCHFGSRYFVTTMEADEMQRLAGMICLDMVAFGDYLYARFMGIGPMLLVNMLTQFGNTHGYPVRNLKGGNLSDHEPFEKAGIPSVWLEYMVGDGDYDHAVHTAADNYGHVNQQDLLFTGSLLQAFLESLGEAECRDLVNARH